MSIALTVVIRRNSYVHTAGKSSQNVIFICNRVNSKNVNLKSTLVYSNVYSKSPQSTFNWTMVLLQYFTEERTNKIKSELPTAPSWVNCFTIKHKQKCVVCDVGNRSCPVTYVPGSKGGSCAHTWHVHATWSSAQSINKRVRTVFNNRSIKHKKQNRSVKTQSNNNQSEIHLPTPAPLWTTELGVRLKWHSLGCNVLASSFSTFIVMTRGAVRVTSTEIGGATKEEKNGFEYKELQLQLF